MSNMPWFNMALVIFSGITFIFSIINFNTSYKNMRAAMSAQAHPIKQVSDDKKTGTAILKIKPARRKSDGVCVEHEKAGDILRFKVNMNVENTGKMPATGIFCDKAKIMINIFGKSLDVSDTLPENIPQTLGPGADFLTFGSVDLDFSNDPSKLEEVLASFLKDDIFITMGIKLKYKDHSAKERTVSTVCKLSRTNGTVLKYEES